MGSRRRPLPGLRRAQGLRARRRVCFLGLDLTRAELAGPPAPLPEGTEFRTAWAFTRDQRPLYEAAPECTADEPGDVQHGHVPYADWLRLN